MPDLKSQTDQLKQANRAEVLAFLDGLYASLQAQARSDALGVYTTESAVRERIQQLEGDGKTRKGKIRELQDLQANIVRFVVRARQLLLEQTVGAGTPGV